MLFERKSINGCPGAPWVSAPPWVPGGNSLGQDEARAAARKILAMTPPAGSVRLTDDERRELEAAAWEPGDTTTPILWLVRFCGERINTQLVWASQAEAEAYARCAGSPVDIIPLCDARVAAPPASSLTLTDAEREAIELWLSSVNRTGITPACITSAACSRGRRGRGDA
jgi:hypothetical protein